MATWSQKDCLNLIEEFRRQPMLWYSGHSNYYNKSKKEEAWIEIAKNTGNTVDEVKKKLDSLKGSFRREKTRVKKRHGADPYQPNWFAYKSLLFLEQNRKLPKGTDQVLEHEKSDSDSDNECDMKQVPLIELKNASSSADSFPLSENPRTLSETSNYLSPKWKKQKRTNIIENQTDDIIPHFETVSVPSEGQRDQCSIFIDFIEKKLRTFDNRLVAIAQHKIHNILFQLEMSMYDQTFTESQPHTIQTMQNREMDAQNELTSSPTYSIDGTET